MSSSASLLGLNVGEYFKLCNWQLLPPPSNNYLPKLAKITSFQRPSILSALSVKEFFDSCHWQPIAQNEPEKDNDSTSPLLPPQIESNFQNPPTVLPCLTVAEFFSLCNWQSLPLEVRTQPLPLGPESPLEPELSLTIQVQTFLQRIPWEGSPEIGRLPQASRSQSIPPAEVEMSLNDLSKLF